MSEPARSFTPVPKNMLARLLYTNPVCLLASFSPSRGRPNVMTITWLTATSNHGDFVMSVNCERVSAGNLQEHPFFSTSLRVSLLELFG